ncbi:S8 family serine peptidase [Draconibacterium sp. IB214405]|uniref:S8 family peptidase n=1 Tax=Draconibacterium sp. IB214405 TaxID=3097352 RepID=UPI002A0D2974|nr:S8 family serine peptidase [Draconibacterium sp. IB214405]MDX8338460.1 S8 family serine peptidase [Draconibacterium sp. IB214405]
MKTLIKTLILLFVVSAFNSCDESLSVGDSFDDVQLKAAKPKLTSWIIQFSDSLQSNIDLLSAQLISGAYEANNAIIEQLAVDIFEKYNITYGEIEKVYGNSIWGVCVTISTDDALFLEEETPEVTSAARNTGVAANGKPVKPSKDEPTPDPVPESQVIPSGVSMVLGNTQPSSNNEGKRVWIIDTGVSSHDELNVLTGKSCVSYTGSANDDNGHGTHLAGIIAAINDTIGVVGVAPGTTIIPIKVLDSKGAGYEADALEGIDFVAANCEAGDVVLIAFNGNSRDYMDYAVEAIAKKGIKVAISAGNLGVNASANSPAGAYHKNIYTVSACDTLGQFWGSSNFGNPPIDICAPGVDIYSTSLNNSYSTLSGTSMSAAHVAGLLVLGWDGEYDNTVSGDKEDLYYPVEPRTSRDDLGAYVVYRDYGKPDPIALLNGTYTINDYWKVLDIISINPLEWILSEK